MRDILNYINEHLFDTESEIPVDAVGMNVGTTYYPVKVDFVHGESAYIKNEWSGESTFNGSHDNVLRLDLKKIDELRKRGYKRVTSAHEYDDFLIDVNFIEDTRSRILIESKREIFLNSSGKGLPKNTPKTISGLNLKAHVINLCKTTYKDCIFDCDILCWEVNGKSRAGFSVPWFVNCKFKKTPEMIVVFGCSLSTLKYYDEYVSEITDEKDLIKEIFPKDIIKDVDTIIWYNFERNYIVTKNINKFNVVTPPDYTHEIGEWTCSLLGTHAVLMFDGRRKDFPSLEWYA